MGRNRKFRLGDVVSWVNRKATYYGVVIDITVNDYKGEDKVYYTVVNTDQFGAAVNWALYEVKLAKNLTPVRTLAGRTRRNYSVVRQA